MEVNKLILGDNLEILKTIESDTIDLIYLDPPFFSNRNYEVIWGDKGEIRSFEDRWAGGIDHYIAWLKERVEQMHRILKPTGSIFLHCDWHADAYIRTGILDKIFGEQNFRGEIIWLRANAHNDAKKKLAVLTDTIWYYSKGKDCTYNPIYVPLSEEYTTEAYRHEDEKGKYRLVVLTGPRVNPNDQEWRGYHPKNIRRSWSVPKEVVNRLVGEEEAKKMSINERLDLLFENGFIEFSKNRTPNYKRYLELSNEKGLLLGNLWNDIKNLQGTDRERIGYPTQKPEKLLERIINCASNEGDIVLDPFVGGGTTIAVADKLNRKWIGIDQSVMAVKVSDSRLKKQKDVFSQDYELILRHFDYEKLRNMDAFEFEKWIIEQFGGKPNNKKGGDNGIDGKKDGVPIQVKRSDNVGVNVIKNFWASLQQFDKKMFEKNVKEKKTAGYIIAFSFGKGAIEEIARLKSKENIIIELKKVSDILPLDNPPKVSLTAEEIESYKFYFEANAESESEIVNYSWDFDHKPEVGFNPDVLMDKAGKQIRKFQQGEYLVAVEAVNKQGLDGQGKVKIKVKEKK